MIHLWDKMCGNIRGAMAMLKCSDTRFQGATLLAQYAVWARGNTHPRGGISKAADNDLPVKQEILSLIEALSDDTIETQCATIMALGGWGDESAAVAVAHLLFVTRNQQVKGHCLHALGLIGGTVSVVGLLVAIANFPDENLRAKAVRGLENLRRGAIIDDSESARQPPITSPLDDKVWETVKVQIRALAQDTSMGDWLRGKARDLLSR